MLRPMKVKLKERSKKTVSKWKRRGHFVMYSNDNTPFLVPLRFLNHPIFRVLLEMAEDEYGLIVHGPLRVPCEKEFVEFVLCLLKKYGSNDDVSAAMSSLQGSMQTPHSHHI